MVAVAMISVAVAAVMEPGTNADEDAASKPSRAIVAVGGAGVRGVVVVAVCAGWWAVSVSAVGWDADADTNRDLSVGVSSRDQKYSE
jgi:hypothetical protein